MRDERIEKWLRDLIQDKQARYRAREVPTGETALHHQAHHQARHRAHHRGHLPGTALEDLPAIPPVTHTGPAAAPAPSKGQAHREVIPGVPFKVQEVHPAIQAAVPICQRVASAG